MDKITFLLFFLYLLFLFKCISGTSDDCSPASCSPTGPQVRFPFRIRNQQPSHCGYPGFDISCNKQNQTILNLTSSNSSYLVNKISYSGQIIYVDPEFCLPERISNFSLTGTAFDFNSIRSYRFYNCSIQKSSYMLPGVHLPCLGNVNYSVIAVQTAMIPERETPYKDCHDIATISVPIRWYGHMKQELELMWFTPFCRSCEVEGRLCGLKRNDGQTTCYGSTTDGIRRSAKHGLIIGIGVSILICILGIVWYVANKSREYGQTVHQSSSIDILSITLSPRPQSSPGLDSSTIESYTKTVLGESRRLPKDDDTCPICLSKYKPREALRTIPECNHYFHLDCIDEWLKLNATCPMCRNSPERDIFGYNFSSLPAFPNSLHNKLYILLIKKVNRYQS
uniref:putative RING-H2 finger protein ATL21A n=1 Tax=Erigeron canadensis TaxID=72917 RepID=UPI001CB952CB|nr:putative RING-H2 finger protein ATL21A [Erigeron canadensis]